MTTPLSHLSQEEVLFQQEVEKVARQHVAPHVMEMDEKEQMRAEIISQFFDLGLMAIEIPEKHGGVGGSFFMSILAVEALSKIDPAAAILVDVQNTLVNNVFKQWGTEKQQAYFFPKLAQKSVGCYCLSESESGSDAFALRCKATPNEHGYTLQGKKIFITNAMEAEIFIVFANTDFSKGYKGITAFVIEKGAAGLSIGKKERKLGIRASSTCEVILDKVHVPQEHIVGEVGKGYKVAINTLNEGRIGIAAQMLGLAQGSLNGALNYADERSQFGNKISSYQGIQFALASLATDIEAARLLTYNAARLKDCGAPFTKEAAMAKYFSSQVGEKVASHALEVYGGYGFIKEFPAEKYYRDAKIGRIYEGTSNMQLQAIFKLIKS